LKTNPPKSPPPTSANFKAAITDPAKVQQNFLIVRTPMKIPT